MTVQDAVSPTAGPTVAPAVTVPSQAGRADAPPRAAAATPAAPLVGRHRPLTTDERQFAVGLAVLALVLGTIIVVGLLVGQYVWS